MLLNEVLGTAASIGVLRTLAGEAGPLPAPSIADRAGLSRSGAWNALRTLARAGVVRTIGEGRSLLHELDDGHRMTAHLRALFTLERDARVNLLPRLQARIQGMRSPPAAVWALAGSRPETLDIAVIDDRSEIGERAAMELHAVLTPEADQAAMRLSIVTMSVDEVRRHRDRDRWLWRERLAHARTLQGPEPSEI